MRHIIKLLLIAFLSVISLNANGQYSLGVEAPKVVAIDETFSLVYTATGKVENFTPPSIDNFSVLAGPSTSTMNSTTYINGKRTHTYQMSYTYILQSNGVEGKYTIPSASVKIDGKEYVSKSVAIEVVKTQNTSTSKSSSSSSGQNNQSSTISNDDILLILSLSKSNVVKGEPVIATLKLYTKVNIAGFEDVKFPVFDGFWSQEMETPTNLSMERENYNGEIYSSALIRKYMLIPQQVGTLKIDPAELVCQVQVRSQGSSSRSIFDDFFDSGYQTIRKRILTSEKRVKVSALPAGAPSSFLGGVGDFKMDVSLSKENLTAHEAASLIVKISGNGNLNMIEAPSVIFPPDFELYDVKKSENITSGSGGTSGVKTFEFPFIPRSSGEFEIPSLEFSYYDINKSKYSTIKSLPIKIDIARGDDSHSNAVVSTQNKQSVKSLNQDIRFIATSSSLRLNSKFFVATPLFYIIVLLILIICVLSFILINKFLKKRGDVARVKNRKALKVAKMRLRSAETLLKQQLYSAFYEEVHKAIIGYMADKFTLSLSEINRDNMKESLLNHNHPEEVVNNLFTLLDACEYARYAPSTGYTAMENDYKAAINVISQIES
jgi:hypothetical protein